MPLCKDICKSESEQLKRHFKILTGNRDAYVNGFTKCVECDIFIKYDQGFEKKGCPCCGTHMRRKSRSRYGRYRKLMAQYKRY